MSFQEGLEGDHGRDRVQWCRLLMSFQEDPHQKLFFQEKIKMANWIIVDFNGQTHPFSVTGPE